jgi:crossover junction endodeoxyribonuclease RuvC
VFLLIILGIDPGFALTGYGVIDYTGNRLKMLEYGVISTKAGEKFSSRLLQIDAGIKALADKYHPDACAIEELFFNNNVTTAISAAQGRGVALTAAAGKGIPVYEYTPLQVKQNVVGYGRAEKKQVQTMVKMLLKLDTLPKPDDAADALAIAICHANSCLTAVEI